MGHMNPDRLQTRSLFALQDPAPDRDFDPAKQEHRTGLQGRRVIRPELLLLTQGIWWAGYQPDATSEEAGAGKR